MRSGDAWDCVHRIWAEFLAAGSVEGLQVRCSESMHRPAFIVDAAGFDSYLSEVLVPWSR
jgi:hypothetical protein